MLFSTAGHFVDRCPGATTGFLRFYTAVFVAFLNVFGLSLLLVGITGFVASWHNLFLGLHSPPLSARIMPPLKIRVFDGILARNSLQFAFHHRRHGKLQPGMFAFSSPKVCPHGFQGSLARDLKPMNDAEIVFV